MSKSLEVIEIPSSSEESSTNPTQPKSKDNAKHPAPRVTHTKSKRRRVAKSYLEILHLYGDGLLPY